MSKKTFRGGIHPQYFKELSRKEPIRILELPLEVRIPLIQNAGALCLPKVKPGDYVKTGALIGDSEKFISSPIHSSVSGKVKAIKKIAHPIIEACDCVVIESDGKDTAENLHTLSEKDIEGLSPEKIKEIIRKAGIVGLGGAGFPTHVKLSPPKEKQIDTFILNGAECEPYLTCDERVMIEKPRQVLKGCLLIMKVLGIKKGFIAIEDNKQDAIDVISAALTSLRFAGYDLQLVILHTKYPQGGEKQLIKALLDREVPAGGLPFDIGCLVDNVQTALAIYEAVYSKKPLYDRVITVTGDAIKRPSNLLVRIGTSVSYIIEKCGGLKEKAGKIIMGGPMMGIAQYTDDIPVVKGTSGILVLSEKSSRIKISEYCIRCGRCIEACPVNLMPTQLGKAAEYGRFDMAEELHVKDCIDCGACAYSCPSHIPLVQLIKHAKESLRRSHKAASSGQFS